ncbi:MAG TPA: hypothetical protein PLN92_01325, partial [Thermotogota bacterium]|nr:hypothetical protein [Thermotogota bacterium]
MKNNKTFIILIIAFLMLTGCVGTKKNALPLTAPVNLYPGQAELLDTNTFYARWTKSAGHDEGDITYILTYARRLEDLEVSFAYETTNNYFLLPNLEGGVWYWQVTAFNPQGEMVSSPVWTFTVDAQGLPIPADPQQVTPDPFLIVSDVHETGFTLDWDKYIDPLYPFNDITYTINVYEDNGTLSNRSLTSASQIIQHLSRTAPATTASTTDTGHSFTNMKTNTSYIWTLIASADASRTTAVGNGPVRTGNSMPTVPRELYPADNATGMATDITFSWEESMDPDGDPLKYYVYIDSIRNISTTATVEGLKQTHYQPENLEEGYTYYWFILVKDDHGGATRTQTYTFDTLMPTNALHIPLNPTPADTSDKIDPLHPPLLQWEHESAERSVSYSVYVSTDPQTMNKQANGLIQKSYQMNSPLKANTTYYWQVEVLDTQSGENRTSPRWSFKTDSIPSPIQTYAQTNLEGSRIELVYDKAMADPSGKHSQYTLNQTIQTGHDRKQRRVIPATKIEKKPGTDNTYWLTLNQAVIHTDCLTINYTPGNIQSADGAYLNPYTDYPVDNQVPGVPPLITNAYTIQTAELPTKTHQIAVIFDKSMRSPQTEAVNQFSVRISGQPVSMQSVNAHATDTACYLISWQETLPAIYGDNISFTYVQGTVQAQNGSYLESFMDYPVQNTVAP